MMYYCVALRLKAELRNTSNVRAIFPNENFIVLAYTLRVEDGVKFLVYSAEVYFVH